MAALLIGKPAGRLSKKIGFLIIKTILIEFNYQTKMNRLFKRRFTKGLVVKQTTTFKFTLVF